MRRTSRARHLGRRQPPDTTGIEGIASTVEQVAGMLRGGCVPPDIAFDQFLPDELRAVSRLHWTPLAVAARVGRWLDELGIETMVDLGAGTGKLCVAAALASRCLLTGIEQRARLVQAAEALARVFGVEDRARVVHGVLGESALPAAQAYYLFNPFGENLSLAADHLDDDVELSRERFHQDVALTEALLDHAPLGTYIIQYSTFGGRLPHGYQAVRMEPAPPHALGLWRKVGPSVNHAA